MTPKVANNTTVNPQKRKYSDAFNENYGTKKRRLREAELEFEVASALYNQASYRVEVAIEYVVGLRGQVDQAAVDYRGVSRVCELERQVMKLAEEYADVLDRTNIPNSYAGLAGSGGDEFGCQFLYEQVASKFGDIVMFFRNATPSQVANEVAAKRDELQEELAEAEADLNDARIDEAKKRTVLDQKGTELAMLQTFDEKDVRQKSSRP